MRHYLTVLCNGVTEHSQRNIDTVITSIILLCVARIHHRHRSRIVGREGCLCFICGKHARLEIHHIHPQRKGGTSEDNNLVAVCEHCHGFFNDQIGEIVQRKLKLAGVNDITEYYRRPIHDRAMTEP